MLFSLQMLSWFFIKSKKLGLPNRWKSCHQNLNEERIWFHTFYILFTWMNTEHKRPIDTSTHISSLKPRTGLWQNFMFALYTKICYSSPLCWTKLKHNDPMNSSLYKKLSFGIKYRYHWPKLLSVTMFRKIKNVFVCVTCWMQNGNREMCTLFKYTFPFSFLLKRVPIWHKTSNKVQIFLQHINTDDTHVTIATKVFCNICHWY